jgi:hypothetical protein
MPELPRRERRVGAVCLTGAEADDMLNEACNTLLTKKMDEAE